MASGGLEYYSVKEIKGPLLVVEGVKNVSYDELLEIETSTGEKRLGKVLEVGYGLAIVQVFEGTTGLAVKGTKAKFLGRTMETPVSEDMLGRIFDGLGRPIDGLPPIIPRDRLDVNGSPINPERRDYPTNFIQTGISAIDGMNTLIRGQKLPIFSGAGLPHNMIAAQIAR
ncbi:MAG TPA: V-type ATP synthase subunit B, partial [Geobacterales bacterium]|nr:V-type ATP synthase subunit B [Geobacterales bacterium]